MSGLCSASFTPELIGCEGCQALNLAEKKSAVLFGIWLWESQQPSVGKLKLKGQDREVLNGEALPDNGNSAIRSQKWQGISTMLSGLLSPERKVSAGDGEEGVAHAGGLGETLRCQAKDFGL